MNFADLIELIDKNYNYTRVAGLGLFFNQHWRIKLQAFPTIDNEIADILVCITFRVVKNALYNYTPASFINGDLQNSVTENQGSAKLFCFGAIHQLTQLEVLHCFGEHYQGVLNDPEGDSHQNIRNFIIYGWGGLKFDSPVLVEK
jgi:hypothetical protein